MGANNKPHVLQQSNAIITIQATGKQHTKAAKAESLAASINRTAAKPVERTEDGAGGPLPPQQQRRDRKQLAQRNKVVKVLAATKESGKTESAGPPTLSEPEAAFLQEAKEVNRGLTRTGRDYLSTSGGN